INPTCMIEVVSLASSERNIVVWAAAATTAAAATVTAEVRIAGRRRLAGIRPAARAIATAAAEELHVLRDHLGDVALVAFLIVVRAVLDTSLDVDLQALRQILRADLRALPPNHDAMPFSALLPLAVLVVPALARRDAQLANALPARRVSHVGIGAQVAHQDDF